MPQRVRKPSEGEAGIAGECLTYLFLGSFVGKVMMPLVSSEILCSLLLIIPSSLTLVFAILDKNFCIILLNNLIKVPPKCDLNSHVMESTVRKRKSLVFGRFFIGLWEEKLSIWDAAAWAWTGGKGLKFEICTGLGRSMAQLRGECKMEERKWKEWGGSNWHLG